MIVIPGERRLTSIKKLVDDMVFHMDGTITIDMITGTVTVQLLEPVTIDGTIAVSGIGGTVTTNTTIANNPLLTRYSQLALTFTPANMNVSNASVTLIAANANRKFLFVQNLSSSNEPVYINFKTPATIGGGIAIRQGESYFLPLEFAYTGVITAISGTSANKEIQVLEGV